MSVTNSSTFTVSTANGATTVFPYDFLLLDEAHLVVEIDGVEITSGFTVDGIGEEEGGNITFDVAPEDGARVMRRRNVPLERTNDYQFQGRLPADTLDEDFDLLWLAMQQLKARADLTPQLPLGTYPGVSLEMPEPEANCFLRWNSDGTGLELVELITESASAAALRADLADTSDPAKGAVLVGFKRHGVAGAVARTVQQKLDALLYPEDFGAIGDGASHPLSGLYGSLAAAQAIYPHATALTDEVDWCALQAALDEVGEGVCLHFNGQYVVQARLSLSNQSGFVLDGNGSTITARAGMAVGSGTQLMLITACTDFVMQGLSVDGNRAARVPAETTSHLLQLTACKRFRLEGVRAVNGTTDGIYLNATSNADANTFCSDFAIVNCTADNCYRQGLSIINGYSGLVAGGSYTNSNGTAPQAGIDIESNAGAAEPSNRAITLSGVTCTGNAGYGVQISSEGNPYGVSIQGGYFADNDLGGIITGCPTTVDGAAFENFSAAGAVGVKASTTSAARLIVTGNSFRNFTGEAGACIDAGSTVGAVKVLGNDFKDVVTAVGSSAPGTEVVSNTVETCSSIGISISATAVNSTVAFNEVIGATGRGIFVPANYANVISNTVKDISAVVGAYIQAEGTGTIISNNHCEASVAAATTHGVRGNNVNQAVILNRCINLHTTDPYNIIGGYQGMLFGMNAGGTANSVRVMRSVTAAPAFSDGSRPAADTVPVGGMIWNSGDNAPNFSDGANWRDASGAIT